MPSYNHERYLPQAISSVINQSYPNWELLIVDDASTDNSFEVASNFTDARIKIFRHKENKGEAKALNTALENVSGDFVCRLDSDDFYPADRLEQCLNNHSNEKGIIMFSDMATVDNYGNILGKTRLKYFNPESIKEFCSIPTATFFAHSSVFNELKFDEKFEVATDYDMLLKMQASHKIHYFPIVSYYRRLHGGNSSYNQIKYVDAYKRLHKKYDLTKVDVLFVSSFKRELNTGKDASVLNKMKVLSQNGVVVALHEANTHNFQSLMHHIELTEPKLVMFEGFSFTVGNLLHLIRKHPDTQFILNIHSTYEYLLHQDVVDDVLRFSSINAKNFYLCFAGKKTADYFRKIYDIECSHIVNPLSEFKVTPQPKENKEELIVTLFGSINPYKNIFTQLQAINLLAEEQPVKLIMTARENEPISLEDEMQGLSDSAHNIFLDIKEHIKTRDVDILNKILKTISKNVELENIGNASPEEIKVKTATADIGFAVSMSESFGYIKAEHEYLGVPVVSSEDCDFSNYVSIYDAAKKKLSQAKQSKSFKKENKEYVDFIKQWTD